MLDYVAVDFYHNAVIRPESVYCNYIPSPHSDGNCFPGLVVLMNSHGYHFIIISDEDERFPGEWDDITEDVKEYYFQIYHDALAEYLSGNCNIFPTLIKNIRIDHYPDR